MGFRVWGLGLVARFEVLGCQNLAAGLTTIRIPEDGTRVLAKERRQR